MDEKYIGRICPYCKTAINACDEITVCDNCETAMHTFCRERAGECVAVGCKQSESAEPCDNEQAVEENISDGIAEDNFLNDNDIAPAAVIDEAAGVAPAPRSAEEIYRHPAFCPVCGISNDNNGDMCGSCGYVFGSGLVTGKKKTSKKTVAVGIGIAAVVLIVFGIIAGTVGNYINNKKEEEFNARIEELNNNLCSNEWYSADIAESLYANSMLIPDTVITFDGGRMHVYVSTLFFSGYEVASSQYYVQSGSVIILTDDGGNNAEYKVTYLHSDTGDIMMWVDGEGNTITFSSVSFGN